MVNRMRHTRAHTANRRSHHAIKLGQFSKCSNCQSVKQSHVACPTCGYYNGRMVIDMKSRLAVKSKKGTSHEGHDHSKGTEASLAKK